MAYYPFARYLPEERPHDALQDFLFGVVAILDDIVGGSRDRPEAIPIPREMAGLLAAAWSEARRDLDRMVGALRNRPMTRGISASASMGWLGRNWRSSLP